MDIYRDINVLYREKCRHAVRKGDRFVNSSGFGVFAGDIPVGSFNEITGKFEPAVNNRGRAYAARKRAAYRRNRRDREA